MRQEREFYRMADILDRMTGCPFMPTRMMNDEE